MKLTPDQLAQFDRDGYLFFPSLFAPEETQGLFLHAATVVLKQPHLSGREHAVARARDPDTRSNVVQGLAASRREAGVAAAKVEKLSIVSAQSTATALGHIGRIQPLGCRRYGHHRSRLVARHTAGRIDRSAGQALCLVADLPVNLETAVDRFHPLEKPYERLHLRPRPTSPQG